jgi:predicted chitinase
MTGVYADLLSAAMWAGVSIDRYWQLSPAMAGCLNDCDCFTVNRVAMLCAQTGHESQGLYYMEEVDWNGDNYAYLEGREDLGNIYPGDGALFHGRGPIQVTGRSNYTECSQWCFDRGLVESPTFFVDLPDELASDTHGFKGVTWYWTTRGLNEYADAGDIDGATYVINGGYNGLDDRTARWNHCLGMGESILGLTDQQAAQEGPQLMGEVVLDYDHNIVGQETGFWCGPASAQVCLSIRGIFVEEAVLAAEMGTDQGGTDYVALIERSLDPRLPEANYSSVDVPHDPPSPEEKERMWDAVLRSINAGYGIVMNWVAPPSNYPVGIKGSQSPNYGGGTIYHYVTCAGYDDNPAQRAVWIADSGFQPPGYWISFDQCCTLIPPKAACYANLPHAAEEAPVPDHEQLNYEQLCGPVDPNTGYGTGWPQLGQNAAGQNLYVVDALSDILHLLESGRTAEKTHAAGTNTDQPLDYPELTYEQLAGPSADEGSFGWPQLGGRTVTDAVAHIKNVLTEQGSEPPFRTAPQEGEGHLTAGVQAVVPPSSPSAEPGPPPAPATPQTWRQRAGR